MTSFPILLAQWLPQAVPAGVVGLFLWREIKVQEKRIDDLRQDMNGLRQDMNARFDRQDADMRELRGLLLKALSGERIKQSSPGS